MLLIIKFREISGRPRQRCHSKYTHLAFVLPQVLSEMLKQRNCKNSTDY